MGTALVELLGLYWLSDDHRYFYRTPASILDKEGARARLYHLVNKACVGAVTDRKPWAKARQ